MTVYLCLTALVVIIAYFVGDTGSMSYNLYPLKERAFMPRPMHTRKRIFGIMLSAFIFVALASVSACRIAVGNDYWVYRDMFKLIMQGRGESVAYEKGFQGFAWIMESLFGYDNYIPVFAVCSIVTAFFFVKGIYDQAENFCATCALLMLSGYYFLSLNNVRYYLVLAIALFSMKYVLRGEYIKFVFVILIAANIHKSVLLVIPAYLFAHFLARIPWKKRYTLILVALTVLLVAGEPLWRKIVFVFYPFYEGSVFDVKNLSLTNIAKCAGTLALCLICHKTGFKDNVRTKFYLFLNLMGTVAYLFCTFIPEISRIGYYFIVCQIFLIPSLLKSMKDGVFKKVVTVGVFLCFFAYFVFFLKSGYNFDVRILPYRTWIFH